MMKKRIYTLAAICILAVSMAACGKIKTEKSIVRWADSTYKIDSTVMDSEKIKDGMQYTLRTDEGVVFTAKSKMEPFGLDGETFFEYEHATSDYYENLIDFYGDQIGEIEEKYHVSFFRGSDSIIFRVYKANFNWDTPEEDLPEVAEAVIELSHILNPQDVYSPPYQNIIWLVKDPEGEDYSNWYFRFIGENAGKIVDRKEEFYREFNKTYPQIGDDARKWLKQQHPQSGELQLSFCYPGTLMRISFEEKDEDLERSYYVDVIKYNQMYENQDGKISVADFGKCIIDTEYIDFVYYEDASKELNSK